MVVPTTPASSNWRLCYAGAPRYKGVFNSPVLDDWGDLEQIEADLGITVGQPFLLRPDGSADASVSAYFASPTFRRYARDSQLSYASDIKTFLSFLERHGTDWRHATEDTLLDFEYWRRRDDSNKRRVSGAKFARELAALGGFYRWQASRGTVSVSPVSSVRVRDRRGDERLRPALRPTNVRSVRVKWLTPRAYRRWRDVGLGGYTGEGLLDETWRGRNDGRNVAMSELMWASGLRLREAATLVLPEIPMATGVERYVRGRLAAATAKGASREYWVSRPALQRISAYIQTTRAEAVRRAQSAGRYEEVFDRMIVTNVRARGQLVLRDAKGRLKESHFDELDASARMHLFRATENGAEPLALWLSEAGMPLPYLTWESVFSDASKRCDRLGVPISCHPHMLRHSFALRMLVTLIHVFDRRLGLTENERLEYRHLFGDPFVLVQTMLGHAQVATTRSYYLEPVNGLQVDMFLNADADEGSIQELLARVAESSPRVQDMDT